MLPRLNLRLIQITCTALEPCVNKKSPSLRGLPTSFGPSSYNPMSDAEEALANQLETARLNSKAASCYTCGKSPAPGSKLLTCARCRVANYCSSACQKMDWKKGHKNNCGTLKQSADAWKSPA